MLVVALDGTSVPGELIAAGRDVVSVQTEGATGTTYLPMSSIGMIWISTSAFTRVFTAGCSRGMGAGVAVSPSGSWP